MPPPKRASATARWSSSSGINMGINADGLQLLGGNSVVRGLAISHAQRDGIRISGPRGTNVLEGNYLGADFPATGGGQHWRRGDYLPVRRQCGGRDQCRPAQHHFGRQLVWRLLGGRSGPEQSRIRELYRGGTVEKPPVEQSHGRGADFRRAGQFHWRTRGGQCHFRQRRQRSFHLQRGQYGQRHQ